MKARKIVMVLGIICLASIMLGCGQKTTTGTGTGTSGDVPKNDRILTVGVLVEPITMCNMQSRDTNNTDQPLLYQIYDTLFYIDSDTGEIKPWLVQTWEFTPDMMHLTLNLRNDVFFHDGSKLTAEDVAFTINENERLHPQRIGMNLDHVEVTGEYQVVIHFIAPYGPVLNWLCARYFNIMSKKYWEEVGAEGYQNNPIGSGPFKFVSRTPGDRIVLERNDNYWQKPSQFKGVEIRPVSDINTMLLALQNGEIDVVLYAPIDNLLYLNDPNVDWTYVNSNASLFLTFCMLEKRFVQDNQNFRKAVQYAIDKEAINQAVYGGRAIVIDSMGNPKFSCLPIPGTYTTYNRDLDKAREYLTAANYNGQEFVVVARAGSNEARAAEVLQGSLQEVGINTKVLAVDNATYQDFSQVSGDYDGMMEAATASILDGDRFFLDFALERNALGVNWKGEGIVKLDDLVHRARIEPDYDKRLALWTEVADVNNSYAQRIFFLVDADTIAFRKDLKNVKPHMARYIRFWEWGY